MNLKDLLLQMGWSTELIEAHQAPFVPDSVGATELTQTLDEKIVLASELYVDHGSPATTSLHHSSMG